MLSPVTQARTPLVTRAAPNARIASVRWPLESTLARPNGFARRPAGWRFSIRFRFDHVPSGRQLIRGRALETDATARARAFGQAHRASSVQSCKRHGQELRHQNPRVGTVAKLSDVEDDEGAIRLDFEKTRLKTPANADQFQPVIMWPSDNWRVEAAAKSRGWEGQGKNDGRDRPRRVPERL